MNRTIVRARKAPQMSARISEEMARTMMYPATVGAKNVTTVKIKIYTRVTN